MIVASDLDRTLIYSRRALKEYGFPPNSRLKPVELRDGEWVSYMTETAFTSLVEVSKRFLFIPVTTRTTSQFKRITIFQEEIPLSYAITTNGAVILRNGEKVAEWSEWISAKMKKESASIEELLLFCNKENIFRKGLFRQVEDLFFYFILEESLSQKEKKVLSAAAALLGWRVSLQSRKLYFMPEAISKGEALAYICNQIGIKPIAGSGDSLLDLDFLTRCPIRIIPNHGELLQETDTLGLIITKSSGVAAGEEIASELLLL